MKTSVNTKTIGEAKISYRRTGMPYAKIMSSYDIGKFLRTIWDQDLIEYSESFCLICLSRANEIVSYSFVSHGGTSATIVDPKMIMKLGLDNNASSLILAHNHPSGNLRPSRQDLDLTTRIKQLGLLMEMPVLDHIILTADSYYSFADEGTL
jgi:DNA repair protein RadC